MELSDAAGKTCRELGYEQWHHDMHMREIAQVIKTKRLIKGEVPFKAPRTGVYGIYEYIFSPVIGEDGDVEFISGTTRDVTEHREAAAVLARSREELERLVGERTAKLQELIGELEHFSYTITHDMRAPLRAMHAFAQILADEYTTHLDSAGADYLRRIIQAASRMDRLIVDSLNYAKAVQTELILEPVDPNVLLRGMLESYPQFQLPRADIQIVETIPPILVNQAGLTQCFSNLIGNAVKFVQPGNMPEVRVRPEVRGEAVRIWIEDNGVGIASDQYDRVFEMFQRVSAQYDGTGVGLALVRKVVDKMRGSVGVVSEPGKGSRFWVEFRRAK